MRLAFAANRASGGGLDPEPLARAMRAAGAEVEIFGCRDRDLERAAEWGPERLAVAGGDGTIGPVAELAGRLGVPLAVVPTGTANDFARVNALPGDAVEAARLAATGTQTRGLELGRLGDGRPFVNAASAGLASVAARRAQPLKPRLGPVAYFVGALRAAATAHPLECTVRMEGAEVFSGGAWQVIVAISGAFGAGSGVDAARPDDGALDVVVIPAKSRVTLARRAWGLRRQTIAEQGAVDHHRGRVAELAVPPGTELNVDGEIRDRGLDRVTVEAGAFALVVG